MLPNESLIPLVLLAALLLVFSLHTLAASGQFPREHRTPALASGAGTIVLYGTIAVAMASLAAALLAAWRLVPWYAAVIGGGLGYGLCFLGLLVIAPGALVLSHLRREVEGNYRQGARDRTGLPVASLGCWLPRFRHRLRRLRLRRGCGRRHAGRSCWGGESLDGQHYS